MVAKQVRLRAVGDRFENHGEQEVLLDPLLRERGQQAVVGDVAVVPDVDQVLALIEEYAEYRVGDVPVEIVHRIGQKSAPWLD